MPTISAKKCICLAFVILLISFVIAKGSGSKGKKGDKGKKGPSGGCTEENVKKVIACGKSSFSDKKGITAYRKKIASAAGGCTAVEFKASFGKCGSEWNDFHAILTKNKKSGSKESSDQINSALGKMASACGGGKELFF